MKKSIFCFATIILACVTVFSSCDPIARELDQKTHPEKYTNPGKAIDLGLSVLWSDVNIGATDVFAPGVYLQWAALDSQTPNNVSDYKFSKFDYWSATISWTKYFFTYTGSPANYPFSAINADKENKNGTIDNITTIQSGDDAASVYWKKGWRIPSPTEWQELIDECTWTYHIGVSSATEDADKYSYYTVTGKNGNSIIITLNGFKGMETALNGYYWTNSLSQYWPAIGVNVFLTPTEVVVCNQDNVNYGGQRRVTGLNIRPVKDK